MGLMGRFWCMIGLHDYQLSTFSLHGNKKHYWSCKRCYKHYFDKESQNGSGISKPRF